MGQYCILLVIYGQRMGSMLTACHVIKYNVHTYNSIENLVTQIWAGIGLYAHSAIAGGFCQTSNMQQVRHVVIGLVVSYQILPDH